jgi:hypothetical protein
MLNFAEQTGSGAVIFVWSFLIITLIWKYINILQSQSRKTLTTQSKVTGNRWSMITTLGGHSYLLNWSNHLS